MKSLADQMNDPAYCNYCRKVTETHEWDCKICGFSKPYPKEYLEQLQIDVASIGKFGSQTWKRITHKPTGISVQETHLTKEWDDKKTQAMISRLMRQVHRHSER